MKKAIVSIIGICVIGAVALCGNPSIRTTTLRTALIGSTDQMQMEVKGASIPTTNPYIDFYLDNVAGWKVLDFYVTAVASGNITTASLTPIYSSGEQVTNSVTLTSGIDMTVINSMFYKMRVYNPNPSIVNTVTMNILLNK